MEAHFMREKFSVLVGAARVLSGDFEMRIGETLEKGNSQFAKEKISFTNKHQTERSDNENN
jgi:hypothetical protein